MCVGNPPGTLFISDTNGYAIRALDIGDNFVWTFAGNGTQGYLDGIGTGARIHRARGIAFDGTSVYWAEFNQHTIRQGIVSHKVVSTLAGMTGTADYVEGVGTSARFDQPLSLVFHTPSNSLFLLDYRNFVIRRIQ